MGIRLYHVQIYRGLCFDLCFKTLQQEDLICFDSKLNLQTIRANLIQSSKQI